MEDININEETIETGKIVGTHGIKGEVKLQSWADSPETLLKLDHFIIDGKRFEIELLRQAKSIMLLKLSGVDNLNKAELLRNKIVFAERSKFTLENGVYFIKDLLGLEAVDADTGICYGKITDVVSTGANDVYELTCGETKKFIPAIKDVIVSTDIKNGKMTIRPLPGLFDENDE